MSVIMPPPGAAEAFKRETDEDLKEEASVARALSSCFGWEMVKLCPNKYIVDFAAFRNGFLASYVEIKSRKITYDQLASFQTFMISANKVAWLKMLAWAGGKSVKAIVVASLIDAILIADVRSMTLQHRYGGRKDREEWRDMEPIAHIHFTEMQLIPI